MISKQDMINACYSQLDCSHCYKWLVCVDYLDQVKYAMPCVMAIVAVECFERGYFI